MFGEMFFNPSAMNPATVNPLVGGVGGEVFFNGLPDNITLSQPNATAVNLQPSQQATEGAFVAHQALYQSGLKPCAQKSFFRPELLAPEPFPVFDLVSKKEKGDDVKALEHAASIFFSSPEVIHLKDILTSGLSASPHELMASLKAINYSQVISSANLYLEKLNKVAEHYYGQGAKAVDRLLYSAKDFVGSISNVFRGDNAFASAAMLSILAAVGLTGCSDMMGPQLEAIRAVIDDPEAAKVIQHALLFTLLGGLGLFLSGMVGLTDNMTDVLGKNIVKMLNWAASKPFVGEIIGAIVTAIIQTSSGTSSVAVGMVNNKTLNLEGAVAILKGANIGTTVTPWLPKLPFAKWGLPIIGAARLSETVLEGRIKNKTFLSFLKVAGALGMLFYGLELMSAGFKNDIVKAFLGDFLLNLSAESFLGVAACVSLGAVITGVVQSSSLVIMVVIPLAMAGLIEWRTAYALIVGLNIGTTVTAQFAAAGKSVNAKRAAHFHTLFNLAGTLPAIFLFDQYIEVFDWLMNSLGVHEPQQVNYATVELFEKAHEEYAKTILALFHTCFNIHNVMLFMPTTFYAFFTKKEDPVITLLKKLVKDAPEDANSIPAILARRSEVGDRVVHDALAIGLSRLAIGIMVEVLEQNFQLLDYLWDKFSVGKETMEKKLFEGEQILNKGQDQILGFLEKIEVPTHLEDYVTREVESGGDKIRKIVEQMQGLRTYLESSQREFLNEHQFSTDMHLLHAQIHEMMNKVFSLWKKMQSNPSYQFNKDAFYQEVLALNDAIKLKINELRKKYIGDGQEAEVDIGRQNVPFAQACLSGYYSYRGVLKNIAQILSGRGGGVDYE